LDDQEDVLVCGRFDDDGRSRSTLLHNYVKACAKAFESAWLPASTVRAERVLITLGINDGWSNLSSLLPSQRDECHKQWKLALQADEILASLPPLGPPGSNDSSWEVMKIVDQAKRLGWLHFWHEALVNDRRGYSCLEARLDALDVAIAKERDAGMTAISPTDFATNQMGSYVEGDIGPNCGSRSTLPSDWTQAQRRDERSGICSHCGTHPSEWRGSNPEPLRPKEFAHCAGCGLAVYCSRECQRAAWKAGHKAECKQWQAEAARSRR
jgi:hypothetical protein